MSATRRPSLADLFNRYGTDKDKCGYTLLYEQLFGPARDKRITILEVGIGTLVPNVRSSMLGWQLAGYRPGGSLRAWRDYFRHGEVWGIDVQTDTQFEEERIRTRICDSTDPRQVHSLFASNPRLRPDVIIDDGSHRDTDQLKTLKNLFGKLSSGGCYIVEDIYPGSRLLTSYWPEVHAEIGYARAFATDSRDRLVITRLTPAQEEDAASGACRGRSRRKADLALAGLIRGPNLTPPSGNPAPRAKDPRTPPHSSAPASTRR